MRVEYETIAAAGVTLQLDDAWLPALWDRIGMAMGLPGFLEYSAVKLEALNHALRNVPEERVRYHLCWGSWHGPHAFDLGFEKIVDLMLRVKAKAYLIEAANARHRLRRPQPSADCVGEAALARRGRRARDQAAVFLARKLQRARGRVERRLLLYRFEPR